jgi:predicted nucleotidyltransferase
MKTTDQGLTPILWAEISRVLTAFPAVRRAVLFGSRAKGTAKPGSDIDLALEGSDLNWRIIGQIYDTLDDLLLPYRFSLIQFGESTDPTVKDHIARVGITIFERELVCSE